MERRFEQESVEDKRSYTDRGNAFQIIPSVNEIKYLKKAIESNNSCLQLTGAHIGNLQQLTNKCHEAGKTVIVNHELVDGLGKDKIAFQMLKKLYHVDGIIGSSITKLHMMKGLNVKVIYRITLMDSISVKNALRTINEVKFDAIELRPYYHAIEFLPVFKKAWEGDYYVAGFVNTEEKLRKCQEAGFVGAMTSTVDLWGITI